MNWTTTRKTLALTALRLFILAAIALNPALTQALPGSADVELIPDVGHVNTIRAISYSPDGRTFASAGADGMVKLWDARSAVLMRTFTGSRLGLLSIAYSADGRRIAAAGENGSAYSWDVGTGTQILATDEGESGIVAANGQPAPVSPVSTAALHPVDRAGDNLLLAVARADKTIALVRITIAIDAQSHRPIPSRKPVALLIGHSAEVLSLAFSPDGKTLASGSADGTVKTWDATDGSLQYSLKSHVMPVRALCFSGDSATFADASDDGDSHRWDLRTGRRLGSRLHHKAPGDGQQEPGIRAVALSADGHRAATGGGASVDDRGGYVALWDVTAERSTHAEAGHTEFVEAVAFSPDGQNIASGGRDHTVRLWDVRTGSSFAVGGDTQAISCLAFSPKADLLASGSADSGVRLWSVTGGELARLLKGHKGTVNAVAFAPTGPFLISGGQDQTINVWNTQTGSRVRGWRTGGGEILCAAFSPDGAAVATGLRLPGGRGAIEVRSFADGHLLRTLDANGPGSVLSISFSPDGGRLASGTGGYRIGTVTIWNVKAGTIEKEMPIAGATAVRAIAFSPDGSLLVSAADRLERSAAGSRQFAEIRVWNGRTGTEQRVVERPAAADRFNGLTIGSDSRTIYAGTMGGAVSTWDARTGERLATFDPAHRGPIRALSLAPGGKVLASAGKDNSVRIWRSETGKLALTLLPVNSEAVHAGVTPVPTSDWLAAAPEGYYSGSADAARSVHWRVGLNQFPVEAYEKLFRKPELIRKALSGEPLPETDPGQKFKDGGTIPPEIVFTVPKDGQLVSGDLLKVEGFITDTQQVLQMEVRVNGRLAAAKPIELDSRGKPIELDSRGKPIELDSRGKPIELDSRGKPIELDSRGKLIPTRHANYQRFHCEVALPPGEQKLTITALAYSGTTLTAREEIQITRADVPVKGTLYVLAIGISRYHDPAYNLKFAKQDADAFAEIWKGKAGGIYTNVQATVLSDDQATSTGIRAALFRLQEQATEKDSVAIFMSGHGVQEGERFFFATHEIEPTSARVADTSLPWTALQTALAAIRARRVTLFLDACHSGSALGGRQAGSERLAELLVKRSGVMVYASSRGSESSLELDAKMHGAFTAALIEGLGEGRANFVINGRRSNTITAEDLLTYLRRRVPELSDNRQTPTCPLLRDFGDAFPLAGAP